MDVIQYLNSQDIADYLKSIDFEFDAMQAAYVIYINEWLTIEKRLQLWQEIIDTMPDCELQYKLNKDIYMKPSAHAAILEHIEKIRGELASFMTSGVDGGQSIYIPISGRWERRPEWLRPKSPEHEEVGGKVMNSAIRPMPFSSFENCVRYLEEETEYFKRCDEHWGKFEPFDRYRIGRTALDGRRAICYGFEPGPEPLNYFLEAVTLNGSFEPIDIKMDWHGNVFENFVPEIPHPFEGGDILIDRTKGDPLPFVFDRCVAWTLEDEGGARRRRESFCEILKEKGIEADESEIWRHMDLKNCNNALGERCSVFGVCYFAHGHMFAYGYELDDASEKELLEYSWGGASDNYMNLEYYNGPFGGKLAILPAVSWFVMNENRPLPDSMSSVILPIKSARKKFEERGMEALDASSYDICSLVNAAFRME